jgi:hypothetical protein
MKTIIILMKKIFIVTLFLVHLFCEVKAQEKITVGILSVSSTRNSYSNYGQSSNNAEVVEEAITEAFVFTKRFIVVDRAKMREIKGEKELQKSEDFIDGKVIQQGKNLGANYLVSTSIIETLGTDQDFGGVVFNISLKLIDVSTSGIISSKIFKAQKNKIRYEIFEWINENFPLMVSIVKVQKADRKDSPIEILIAAGSLNGLAKNDKLTVIEIEKLEVDGQMKTRNIEIGQLQVEKVEGPDFSVCKILDGASLIGEKIKTKSNIKAIPLKKEISQDELGKESKEERKYKKKKAMKGLGSSALVIGLVAYYLIAIVLK